MPKTVTTIIHVGSPPAEEILNQLRQTGRVTIHTEELVEIVSAPNSVRKKEKFYRHSLRDKGLFWTKVLNKLIEEGYTLFHDEHRELWIRITPKFTYLFTKALDSGNYVRLHTAIFIDEIKIRSEKVKNDTVYAVFLALREGQDVLEELIDYMSEDEARNRMSWDGKDPLCSIKNQEPPYFYSIDGSFGWKQFLDYLDKGFILFNYKDEIFIAIRGNDMHVFRETGSGMGKYMVIDLVSFKNVYIHKVKAYKFSRRIKNTLSLPNLKDITIVQTESELHRKEALTRMKFPKEVIG